MVGEEHCLRDDISVRPWTRDTLRTGRGKWNSSGGVPLCDDLSILGVRLATSDERARYHDRTKNRPSTDNRAAVFLVDVDVNEA